MAINKHLQHTESIVKKFKQPLVSVIITTYNTDKYCLTRAIKSVLTQTYQNIELIVVDDGSNYPFDNADTDFFRHNICWICLLKNRGVGVARNIGLSASKGKYVAFLDHDDWWERQKIEKQVSLLQESKAGWVYCGIVVHDKKGNILRTTLPKKSGDISKEILKNQIINGSVSAVMTRREILVSVGGFSENRNIIEDWDLWIRMAETSCVEFVPEALAHLGQSEEMSRSQNVNARLRRLAGLIHTHKERYQEAGLFPYIQARYYRKSGLLLQQSGDFPGCIKSWSKLVFTYPAFIPKKRLIFCIVCTLPYWFSKKVYFPFHRRNMSAK